MTVSSAATEGRLSAQTTDLRRSTRQRRGCAEPVIGREALRPASPLFFTLPTVLKPCPGANPGEVQRIPRTAKPSLIHAARRRGCFLTHDAVPYPIGCRSGKELQPIGVLCRPAGENRMIERHFLPLRLVGAYEKPGCVPKNLSSVHPGSGVRSHPYETPKHPRRWSNATGQSSDRASRRDGGKSFSGSNTLLKKFVRNTWPPARRSP